MCNYTFETSFTLEAYGHVVFRVTRKIKMCTLLIAINFPSCYKITYSLCFDVLKVRYLMLHALSSTLGALQEPFFVTLLANNFDFCWFRSDWQRRAGQLLGIEGRRHRFHPNDRQGAGQVQHQSERRLSRLHQDSDVGCCARSCKPLVSCLNSW